MKKKDQNLHLKNSFRKTPKAILAAFTSLFRGSKKASAHRPSVKGLFAAVELVNYSMASLLCFLGLCDHYKLGPITFFVLEKY